jgi:transposase
MSKEFRFVGSPAPMVEPEIVKQIHGLSAKGWGAKRISQELGVARNTVRRYLRGGDAALAQKRPGARKLAAPARAEALAIYDGAAEGNAVGVHRLLQAHGLEASVRTVQRAVEGRRRERRAEAVASVRFETAPGHQLQIDFGQKIVSIDGQAVRLFLLVAVLSYSRRLFAKAFLCERQDDWLEGVADAFRHFGGVTRTVLGDNARALVASHDRTTATIIFAPAYLQFCRDWGFEPRACAPYRARTKGKVEAGVKYVKRNALAGRSFESFAALESHLESWMLEADGRVHQTTHETPRDRFERDERDALCALPAMPLATRQRRVVRRVSADALVDIDTVRYSVPHRYVRDHVEVLVGESQVRIYRGSELCAVHQRSFEPFSQVINAEHYAGLWRPQTVLSEPANDTEGTLAALGRTLADYAAAIDGGAA